LVGDLSCETQFMDSFSVLIHGGILTEEKQEEIYGRMIREYQEILTKLASCTAELKRIGESYTRLGTDMIDPREVLAIDQASFNADVAITPVLIVQYSELAAKKADKQAELEKFGPLPRFAA
jgi:hypothetical protein